MLCTAYRYLPLAIPTLARKPHTHSGPSACCCCCCCCSSACLIFAIAIARSQGGSMLMLSMRAARARSSIALAQSDTIARSCCPKARHKSDRSPMGLRACRSSSGARVASLRATGTASNRISRSAAMRRVVGRSASPCRTRARSHAGIRRSEASTKWRVSVSTPNSALPAVLLGAKLVAILARHCNPQTRRLLIIFRGVQLLQRNLTRAF